MSAKLYLPHLQPKIFGSARGETRNAFNNTFTNSFDAGSSQGSDRGHMNLKASPRGATSPGGPLRPVL